MEFLGFSRRVLNLQALRQTQRYSDASNIASDTRDFVLESIKGSEGGQFVEGLLTQGQRTLASFGIKTKKPKKKSESGKAEVKANHYFVRYEQGLFKRLDKMISLMGRLLVPTPQDPKANMVAAPRPPRRSPFETNGGIFAMALLAATAGAGNIVEYLSAGIGGSSIARGIRDVMVSRARRARNARRIRRAQRAIRSGRVTPLRTASSARPVSTTRRGAATLVRRVTAMTAPIRRGAARVGGFIISRLGGLSRLFRLLGIAARRIPILLTLLVPIQEAIESNSEINELYEQLGGENMTPENEAIFRQQATESVIRAIIETIGTVGGGIAGGLVGGLLGVGVASVVTSIAGGTAGAWIGHELATWLSGLVAPTMARAINSTNVDQLVRAISDALTGRVPVRELLQGHLPDSVIDRIVASYEATQQIGRVAGNTWNWATTQGANLYNNAVRAGSTFLAPPVSEPTRQPTNITATAPREMTPSLYSPAIEATPSTTIIVSAPTTNITRNNTSLNRRPRSGTTGTFNTIAAYA